MQNYKSKLRRKEITPSSNKLNTKVISISEIITLYLHSILGSLKSFILFLFPFLLALQNELLEKNKNYQAMNNRFASVERDSEEANQKSVGLSKEIEQKNER